MWLGVVGRGWVLLDDVGWVGCWCVGCCWLVGGLGWLGRLNGLFGWVCVVGGVDWMCSKSWGLD